MNSNQRPHKGLNLPIENEPSDSGWSLYTDRYYTLHNQKIGGHIRTSKAEVNKKAPNAAVVGVY